MGGVRLLPRTCLPNGPVDHEVRHVHALGRDLPGHGLRFIGFAKGMVSEINSEFITTRRMQS